MTSLLVLAREAKVRTRLPLSGLEVDNLLSFLALLGMLRAIEEREPNWAPRVVWEAKPWRASLDVAAKVDAQDVSSVVTDGLLAVINRLEQHRPQDANSQPLADVSFERVDEFANYARSSREQSSKSLSGDANAAQLAACLSSEWPLKKSDVAPIAGPLVMMFGQGHQHFLSRYFDVPRAPVDDGRVQSQGDVHAGIAATIQRALFSPWCRADEAQGFRWDPEDDQRYALRFGNPSKAGAANTEDGANRLATLGFLSFPSVPAFRATTRGVQRGPDGVSFLWPVWSTPLSRSGIESLLSHPDLIGGNLGRLKAFGVDEIYRARRVSNGKFMNVARASPVLVVNGVARAAKP
jgi:hypothetical protein